MAVGFSGWALVAGTASLAMRTATPGPPLVREGTQHCSDSPQFGHQKLTQCYSKLCNSPGQVSAYTVSKYVLVHTLRLEVRQVSSLFPQAPMRSPSRRRSSHHTQSIGLGSQQACKQRLGPDMSFRAKAELSVPHMHVRKPVFRKAMPWANRPVRYTTTSAFSNYR